MAEVSNSKKKNIMFYVHSLIGILLMFGFGMLPALDPITPMGMKIVGIFIGVIYLWSFIDMVWPSILGLIALEMTGCLTMPEILAGSFADNMTVLMLFGMMFFGVIQNANVPAYIGQWFLERKISRGRPLLFLFIYLFAVYFMAAIGGILNALLLFLPITYSIIDRLGYDHKDRFVPILIIGVFLGGGLGQPALPIKGGNLVIIAAFQKISGMEINALAYILYSLGISLCLIAMYILLIKFAFRPDLNRLKQLDDSFFAQSALPAMNKQQKFLFVFLVMYLAVCLLPGMLPKTWFLVAFLRNMTIAGITMFFVVLLCLIRFDGKPLFDIKDVSKHINWGIYFLIAMVMLISSVLTSDTTGVKPFLANILDPILGGKSFFVFAFLLLALSVFLTNIANNAVIGAIMATVIFTFSETMQFDPVPLVVVMTMIVFFLAWLTPGASPYAAMLHGLTDWVTKKDIYIYSGITIILGTIVCTIIGVPLATFLFSLF